SHILSIDNLPVLGGPMQKNICMIPFIKTNIRKIIRKKIVDKINPDQTRLQKHQLLHHDIIHVKIVETCFYMEYKPSKRKVKIDMMNALSNSMKTRKLNCLNYFKMVK